MHQKDCSVIKSEYCLGSVSATLSGGFATACHSSYRGSNDLAGTQLKQYKAHIEVGCDGTYL